MRDDMPLRLFHQKPRKPTGFRGKESGIRRG